MKKILITGGSGFIGTNMVQYYLNKGIEILNFDINPPLDNNHNKFWKKGDINLDSSLDSIFSDFNPTHVIHLAAATGLDVGDISHFKTNFDGLESLINRCNSSDSLEKVIITSSLLVCERTYVPKDDIDFKPDSLYGQSKVMSEKIVRNSDLKAQWAIVRPTAVWGPWFRSSYTTFFKLIKKGLYINPGKKRLDKPATFVGNAVYMIDKILESDVTHGQVYYLSDYPEYSIQQWANSIANYIGEKEPITIPKFFINSLAIIGNLLKLTHLNLDPPLTTFRLNNILSSAKYDLNRTSSVVGELPYSLDDGVGLTIDWMNNNTN